jgi:hypothetical protein
VFGFGFGWGLELEFELGLGFGFGFGLGLRLERLGLEVLGSMLKRKNLEQRIILEEKVFGIDVFQNTQPWVLHVDRLEDRGVFRRQPL